MIWRQKTDSMTKKENAAKTAPSGLMADLRQEPAGVGKKPGFSWIMNSEKNDRIQTAFQILVSSTLAKANDDNGDLWDSQKVLFGASSNVAYGGKALEGGTGYYWKVRTWDNEDTESPCSLPQRFFTAVDRWTADAIWAPSDVPNVMFARRSFRVDRKVENAVLHITASSNARTRQYAYKAYVNGKYTGLGPQFRTLGNQYLYNSFDITDCLVSGENVLGAICYALSDKKLMAELKITYADGASETIATDSAWKVLDGTAAYGDDGTSIGTGYYTAMAENIDANHYPYGWDLPGYDDSSWTAPGIKNAIPNLAPSGVDPVGEYEVIPAKIQKKAAGHYFIDLGKEIIGGIRLAFADIDAPAELEMRYGEELAAENTVMYEMRTGNRYLERFVLKKGSQTFQNFGMKGFRYIEVLNSPVEITKDTITGIAIRQRFDDEESYFHSDSPVLDDIYELCKYSIKATAQDMLVDSQTRERGPYEGDLYVNQLSLYSFMRNYNVARFTNEALACQPTWPAEYHMMTIMSSYEDYMYTGDTSSLEKLYPLLQGKLRAYDGYFRSEYNLYQPAEVKSDGTGRILVDWPDTQRDGYVINDTDFNTVANAFHYAAAAGLSKIAKILHKNEDAVCYSDLAEKVKLGMERLYVPSRKCFSDGMDAEGRLIGHYARHASFFPLALGIVDNEEQMADMAGELGANGIVCSIYATQFLLTALYRAGSADAALTMLTSTEDGKSWYHAIRNLGATIVPECWDPRQKPNMTFSHAWGSSPANIIVRNLCGITPLEAGFGKIQIRPQLGRLRKIAVKVPNIKGYVCLDINMECRTLRLDIPANTTALLYIPFHDHSEETLCLDGVPVKAETSNEYYVYDGIGSGIHTFTVCSTKYAI